MCGPLRACLKKNQALGFGEHCGQSLTDTEVSHRQLITQQCRFHRLNSVLIIQALSREEYVIIQSVAMRIAHNGENGFFPKQGSLLVHIKMITICNPDRSSGCLCRKMATYVPEIAIQNLSLL